MRQHIVKILALIFTAALLSGCITNTAPKHDTSATEQQFQTAIETIYAQHPDAVGIMVHVEMPAKNISWSGAVGVSDKALKTPIEPDAPAWIASNTKTYMAAAVLRLVEDGKFNVKTTIDTLLTPHTLAVLQADGYKPNTINVEHLLTHTSGIIDYAADMSYFKFSKANPKHRWTRDTQIARAMEKGDPLGDAGDVFAYADTNYLLLAEILERATGKDFYTAVRDLIDYKKQGMNQTWFLSLEDKPKNTKPLVHQYATKMGLHNYDLDPSFDLYGGGGLAATTKDAAVFTQNLFTNKIFKSPATLTLMQTKAVPKKKIEFEYLYGLSTKVVDGHKGIGHGGFWGTAANYFPDLDMSLAVFVLERDQRILRRDVNQAIVGILTAEKAAE